MYLSRIYVSWPRSKSVYSLHQALWELFPDRPDADRDFLFRVEHEKTGQGALLLLQSRQEPVSTTKEVDVQAVRSYALQLSQGQRVRFLMQANPVKTIKDVKGRKNAKGEVKSCRVPLIKEEEQLHWLARKFEGVAELEEVRLSACHPLYFKKDTHAGKVVPVRFEGVLVVADPNQFVQLMEKGVGPAKALGCGMLSIAPA